MEGQAICKLGGKFKCIYKMGNNVYNIIIKKMFCNLFPYAIPSCIYKNRFVYFPPPHSYFAY